jgi:hypothetical protein
MRRGNCTLKIGECGIEGRPEEVRSVVAVSEKSGVAGSDAQCDSRKGNSSQGLDVTSHDDERILVLTDMDTQSYRRFIKHPTIKIINTSLEHH